MFRGRWSTRPSKPAESLSRALRGIQQARIHDIGRLVQLLESDGVELPPSSERLDELTIYAVPLRYDDLLDAEPLDRDETVHLLDEVEEWARRLQP